MIHSLRQVGHQGIGRVGDGPCVGTVLGNLPGNDVQASLGSCQSHIQQIEGIDGLGKTLVKQGGFKIGLHTP